MKTQPIKRSDELKVLSREHHFGLLFAWKVREGLKLNVETSRLNAYVNHFWEDHLKNHFLNEEVLLFNMVNDPLCIQAKNDHIAIITQIEKINSFGKDDPNAYTKLAEILSNHIRFEERIAFPHLEEKLSAAKLHGISLFLEKDYNEEFINEYEDEFWIKKK